MKKTALIAFFLLSLTLAKAQTHWQAVDPPGSSGLTATLSSIIVIDGEVQCSDQLEVGVFHGDECRGANLASYVPVVDSYIVYLSIFGIEDEEDSFRLYDHATGTEVDVTCGQIFVYHSDQNTGTIFEPFEIDFQSVLYTYIVEAKADPEEWGVVTGNGTYPMGQTVVMEAKGNPGYQFVNWTEGGVVVSDDSRFSFIIDRDRWLVAHFIANPVSVEEESEPQISLFPNPVTDRLVVSCGNPVCQCNVYNINGILLFSTKECGYKFEIPLNGCLNGIYLIKIYYNNTSKIIKFIKQ